MNYKWNEREVRSPLGKFAVILGVATYLLLSIPLSPLWLPASWALRAAGRNGFYTYNRPTATENGSFELHFAPKAFRRIA